MHIPNNKIPSVLPSAFCIILLTCLIRLDAAVLTGKVVSLADGDSFTLLVGSTQVKIRLYGIDCPEKGQPWGRRATQFASEAIFGKEITVTVVDTDRYGRKIGKVHLPDGQTLNERLVEEGLAWWYVHYARNNTRLRDLEAAARKAQLGLWADKDPIAPWEWRRGRRASDAAVDASGEAEEHECPYWLNTKTDVRHNPGCRHYQRTANGRCTNEKEGKACGACGG